MEAPAFGAGSPPLVQLLQQRLKLCLGANAQLGVGVFGMGAHGVLADVKVAGNGGLAAALGDERRYLGLALGQAEVGMQALHAGKLGGAQGDILDASRFQRLRRIGD
jgi:hypothetical protein